MREPRSGDHVFDVRGKRIGAIQQVRSCCFEVQDIRIRPAAIFQVTEFSVELICDRDQLDRYACKVHGPERQ